MSAARMVSWPILSIRSRVDVPGVHAAKVFPACLSFSATRPSTWLSPAGQPDGPSTGTPHPKGSRSAARRCQRSAVSGLLAVWFQEAPPPVPTEPEIVDLFSRIDWDALAASYWY
jgi:hypothetical protein